ncbi:deleted in malignant brain tumors 1 protein-like isoform X2 [Mercenaria mercenaria]|uniref:deleted in malignant brain tumors 1 protein-like isoform X2 n=1 Tax=Mercenaria mercenaria TaxID=6596 RepID=UPI00234E68BE|nr:deleted in malignant brain tumors 1 protein-like isoform X2 [Mercenaria mercenaria]
MQRHTACAKRLLFLIPRRMAQYFNISMYEILILVILLLIGNKSIEGCEEGWELNVGKCYLFSMQYYGWEDAKKYCENLEANLVKIDDDDEHKYIKSRLSAMDFHYAWIGAKYSRAYRKHLWIDGSEMTFNGWAPKEPGNRRGCVAYLHKYNHLWRSHCDCKYTRGTFICEKVPKGHDEGIVDKEDSALTRINGPEPTLKPTNSTVDLDYVFKGSDFCGKETTVTTDSLTQTEKSRLTPSYVQKSTADEKSTDTTGGPDVDIPSPDWKELDSTDIPVPRVNEKTDGDIKIGRIVSDCGGEFTSRQGILESPGFPNYYTNNLRCYYTLNMDPQHVILLSFDRFDIEYGNDCRFDWVAVYAGNNANSLLLGKYCDKTVPLPIRSLGQMHIQFWTDSSVVYTGFRAHYTVCECGDVFTEPHGIIETPEGSTDYHNKQNCTWIIAAGQKGVVQLKFQMFDLQAHSTCSYEYLVIYDGPSVTSPLIGRYCGDVMPSAQIRSTSNTLTINFITDSSVTSAGFRAAYNTTYDCGGVLTSRQGILQSPGFPNYYTNDLRCNYTLVMDPQHVILLSFEPDNFDIESGRDCRYDWVAVYAGNNSNSLLLGKYCGDTAPLPISSLGQMHIEFWTDDFISRHTGFRANYTVIECGGVFTEHYGIIETPNGLTDYHNNHNCTWSITVVPNRVIQLKFQMFDLQADSTCSYDYLDIYDGPSLTSPLIGQYCGDVIPFEQIRSTSNTMTINFVTDSSVTRAGFRAAYNATYCCGCVFTSRQGILGSPGFPNYYTNDLRCNYTLDMDPQHVILLSFDPDNFDIEPESDCEKDWVAVYAGNNSNSLLLGKYCGDTAPLPISSLGQMHIEFWTDYSIVHIGFRANYTVIECGGVFTEHYGIIETPNKPTDYHNNQNCTWSITVVPNRVIQLKFQMFDLQADSTCSYDYLDIYDGPSLTSPLIGRYCGDGIPSEQIRSTSNTMTINFVTDSSVTRAGFRAAYNTTYYKPNYVCYPNNRIIVHDLPKNSYYFAMQNISSGTNIRCTVSTLNATTVEITGCLKDDPILFTYGLFSGIETYQIHVGQSVDIYVRCYEITEDGVAFVINDNFAATLQIDSNNTIDPSYNVSSSLNTTFSYVGEPVAWTITFPVEYILEVTSCTAEPYTTDNTDLLVQLISEGGCMVDSELISNFKDNLDGTAVATLWSFKSVYYDTILLKCAVIICPGASNACNTTCSRLKRDIPDRPYRQADDSFSTVVESRLHVIDHKSSETMPAPDVVAVVMFQLVAVLLIK